MHLCFRFVVARPQKQILAIAMSQRRPNSSAAKPKDSKPATPRPSASVILVSPTNKILLLHRVQTSSAFPSAYVFAGGNLSADQDGPTPEADSPARHVDSEVYRLAAIRETFEESGILLAKKHKMDSQLVNVRSSKLERARKAVHANELKLTDWLSEIGAEPDIDGLLPFTRWITPPNVPKRFTTQMYLYFLPLNSNDEDHMTSESQIPQPTSDGGLEHTAAEFDYASNWLSLANPKAYPRSNGDTREPIIIYPPQVFLLHLLAPMLPVPQGRKATFEELSKQRESVYEYLKTSQPVWAEKCISPMSLGFAEDGRSILSLEKPGPELVHSERKGEFERVALTRFTKAGPKDVEIVWRKDVRAGEPKAAGKL